jgi:hypothetical protein
LVGPFQMEKNSAYSFNGLGVRLYSKLTAHTLGIYRHKRLGKVDFLPIKVVAFPG